MKLAPSHPPGRSSRKALAYADEIARLVADGYSGEAIRRALADAGVAVSKTTMKREVARAKAQPKRRRPDGVSVQTAARSTTSATSTGSTGSTPSESGTPTQALAQIPPTSAPSPSGRETAEAFMQGRINHPLLRARSKP